jgi:hypothetical protein
VTTAYITGRTPAAVAREVEFHLKAGCGRFLLRELDSGGMLDRERLGAARYAAGIHTEVELEGQSSPAGASEAPEVGAPEVARTR